MAVHVVLEEIGAPYEKQIILSRGEREGEMTASETWRAINPKGRVPALLGVQGSIGGTPELLTEATAIMVFLAASYPQAKLLPQDPAPLARCLEWMNWLASNVHAMTFGQIWRAHRFSDDEPSLDSIREKGRRTLLEQYGYIDRLLSDGRDWAVPEGYSIADPYLLVFYQWGKRVGVDMRGQYTHWSRVTDRTLSRPAVQRVLLEEGVVVT